MLNTRGEVAEATSSNIFLVLRGTLVTPPLEANILPGITRQKVLAMAESAGYNVATRAVHRDELFAAEEAFLTNSVAEVVPLRSIEGRSVGTGGPGAATRELHEAYRNHVRGFVAAADRPAAE